MGYLGRQPSIGRFAHLDDITSSFNSACTTFSLTQASVPILPGAASNLIVSLGGVLQEPEVAYTVSGSTIVFSAAPANTQPFFGILLGDVLDVGQVSQGAVINASSFSVGANVVINTSAVFVGNSTANVIQTSSAVTVGANVVANTSTVFLGNSTANLVLTSTSLTIANSTANLVLTPTDIYSVAWTDYTASSTITGWSSFTANRKIIKYKKIGKLVFVQWHLEGTSNATSVSFTLPYTCVNNTGTGYPSAYGTWFGYDNGAYLSTIQSTYISAGSSLVEHRTSPGTAAGWTASGTKISSGTLFYESTT